MKSQSIVFAALISSLSIQAQEDSWFDESGPETVFSASIGQYSESGSTGYFSLQIPTIGYSTTTVTYSVLNADRHNSSMDEKDSTLGISVDSDALAATTFGCSYAKTDGVAENSTRWQGRLGYNWSNWHLEGSIIGSSDQTEYSYTLRNNITRKAGLKRDRIGLGAGLSYFRENWAVNVRFTDYALFQDTLFQDTLFQDTGSTDNRLAEQFFSRRTFAASRGITDSNFYLYRDTVSEKEWALGLATTLYRFQLDAGVSSYKTPTDDHWLNSAYASSYYPLTPSLDAGILTSLTENSVFYSELGMSVHW